MSNLKGWAARLFCATFIALMIIQVVYVLVPMNKGEELYFSNILASPFTITYHVFM